VCPSEPTVSSSPFSVFSSYFYRFTESVDPTDDIRMRQFEHITSVPKEAEDLPGGEAATHLFHEREQRGKAQQQAKVHPHVYEQPHVRAQKPSYQPPIATPGKDVDSENIPGIVERPPGIEIDELDITLEQPISSSAQQSSLGDRYSGHRPASEPLTHEQQRLEQERRLREEINLRVPEQAQSVGPVPGHRPASEPIGYTQRQAFAGEGETLVGDIQDLAQRWGHPGHRPASQPIDTERGAYLKEGETVLSAAEDLAARIKNKLHRFVGAPNPPNP